jgi:hypothetical protein
MGSQREFHQMRKLHGRLATLPPPPLGLESEKMDPSPDYDASGEIEYGINWFRGSYGVCILRPRIRRYSGDR